MGDEVRQEAEERRAGMSAFTLQLADIRATQESQSAQLEALKVGSVKLDSDVMSLTRRSRRSEKVLRLTRLRNRLAVKSLKDELVKLNRRLTAIAIIAAVGYLGAIPEVRLLAMEAAKRALHL